MSDSDKFDKLPRIYTVEDRIAASETFPRIRDATLATKAKMKKLRDKVEHRDFLREQARKERELHGHGGDGGGSPESGTVKSIDMIGRKKVALVEEEEIEHGFFTAHVLNEDPEMSKYLPYDSLVYPKPYEVTKMPPEFIDKLWISGFMDRANRDGPQKMKAEQRAMAKIRKDKFAKEDGSSIASFETDEFMKIGIDKDAEEAELERQAEARARTEKLMQDLMKAAARRAGKDVPEDEEEKLIKESHLDTSRSYHSLGEEISVLESIPSARVSLSDDQKQARQDLKDLEVKKKKKEEREKRLEAKRKATRDAIPKKFHAYRDQIESSPANLAKQAAAAKLSVEQAEAAAKAQQVASFLSMDLDFVFDRERQEHEAAKRIQKSWKRIGRLKPWKKIVKNMLAARTIQRMVKGMITRKWVARWYNYRHETIKAIQATIRKVLSNNKWFPQADREWAATIKIQKIVRGKFGRIKADRLKYSIAVIHIQALWRGVSARSKCDKMWLDKVVVPIQTMVRGKLAKNACNGMRDGLEKNAIIIQKKFRCWCSIRKTGEKLIKRENEYRMDNIAQLTAEEEWVQERIEKVLRRFLKKDFQGKASARWKKYLDGLQSVYDLENDVIEMNRQKEILSPRAIVQGYYQELSGNCIDLRNRLTDLKEDVLFKSLPLVHEMDVTVDNTMAEIERVAGIRTKLLHCRDSEYADRLEREYQRDLLTREKKERQAIAEEKRRWTVKWYTSDGKPDKRRRPGRAWDKDVYAGVEKMTYNPKSIDILGELPDKNKMKPGSDESVEATLNQMSLQTYLSEIYAYESLLNPITNIMQTSFGAPMGQPAPEDLGWGEEGKKLAPAMWKTGAVPSSWHRPLSPGGTTALSAKQLMEAELKAQEEAEIAAALAYEQELLREEEEKKLAEQEMKRAAKKGWGKLKGLSKSGLIKGSKIPDHLKPDRKGGPQSTYTLGDPRHKLKQLKEAAEAERRREIARDKVSFIHALHMLSLHRFHLIQLTSSSHYRCPCLHHHLMYSSFVPRSGVKPKLPSACLLWSSLGIYWMR